MLRLTLAAALTLSGVARADEPPEESVSPISEAATSSNIVPIAQLENAQAGEAFVGKEVVIEGQFLGMLPLSTTEQIQMPRKYKKTHARFVVGGEAGAACRNIVLPLDLAGPLFSMTVGARIRVTGTVDHILSPAMVQASALNRIVIATRVDQL